MTFVSIRYTSLLPALAIACTVAAFEPQPAAAQTASNVVCRGCVDSRDIKGKAIRTNKIRNNAVTGAKIRDNAVTGAKIADGSVGNADLGVDSVTSDKIAPDAVGFSEIATGAVGASEIATGAVGFLEIGSSAVRGNELATVRVASVECNGPCNDSNLGQICGGGFSAIAVDCQSVDHDGTGVACGGNNRCSRRNMSDSDPLSFYCDDTNGWDAQVYCLPD